MEVNRNTPAKVHQLIQWVLRVYTSVGLFLVVRVNTSVLFSTDADLLLRSWTLWLLRWNHQGWRQNHCTGCAVWGLSAHVITNVFFLSFYFFMWKTSAVHDIQAAKLQKKVKPRSSMGAHTDMQIRYTVTLYWSGIILLIKKYRWSLEHRLTKSITK